MRSEAVQLVKQAVSERANSPPLLCVGQQPIRGECAVDGAGTCEAATRQGYFGLRIHHREYTRTCPSHDPNHSALIPRSDARKGLDMLAVPISTVLQPLDLSSWGIPPLRLQEIKNFITGGLTIEGG